MVYLHHRKIIIQRPHLFHRRIQRVHQYFREFFSNHLCLGILFYQMDPMFQVYHKVDHHNSRNLEVVGSYQHLDGCNWKSGQFHQITNQDHLIYHREDLASSLQVYRWLQQETLPLHKQQR